MNARWEIQAGSLRLRVVDAPITDLGERLDALVSSDDNYLTHGGGVAHALWEAAGPAVEREAGQFAGNLRLGQVAVTTAGDLNATYLFHAITIDFDENRALGPAGARSLFESVLDTAIARGCRSLATPLLGTGAGRLNVPRFLNAAVDAIEERLDAPAPLELLVFSAPFGGFGAAREILEHRLAAWMPLRSLVDAAAPRFSSSSAVSAIRPLLDSLSEATVGGFELALSRAFELVLDELVRGTRQSGDESGESVSGKARLSLGQKLQLLRESRVSVGRPIPNESFAAFQAANIARNRIVHGQGGLDALKAERGALQRALRIALELLSREPEGQIEPSAEGGPFGAATRDYVETLSARKGADQPQAIPIRETAQARDTESTASPVLSGTEHVRRLHEFLLAHLDEECRPELLERLKAEGYRGTPDMCLLEYCVRLEDPAEILGEWFSPPTLRREAQKATGVNFPAGTRQGVLVRALLEHFGFPPTGRPVGLPTVMGSLEASRSEVHRSSLVELKGLVTDASARLERALRIVIHFVARAAFGEPAENVVRKKGWLPEGLSLDRCSLGKLLELVERLDKALRSEPTLETFQADFQATSLFAEGSGSIASYRNRLSHYSPDTAAIQLSSARAQALEFFDDALLLLKGLRDRQPPLFPIVIEVLEVRIDRYGRQTIEARTDDGRNEVIFTDFPLQPGQVYFMHPLSNPFRVFPVLQPAGDLGTDSGETSAPAKKSGSRSS